MKHITCVVTALMFLFLSYAGMTAAMASDDKCAWFVILGCSKDAYQTERLHEKVRGIVLPGSTGTFMLQSSDYPNFNPGLFCVADGPFSSQIRAENVHWDDMIPKAYVKRGC